MKSFIKVNALAAFLGLALASAGLAQDLRACGGATLRFGVEAGEWAAMNAAEAQFLGTHATDPGVTGGGFGLHELAQGTESQQVMGGEVAAGLCTDKMRFQLRASPMAADLPNGIGIFTDPATMVGSSVGLRAERFFWAPLGQWRAGIGLGLQADWVRLHIRSALIDMRSRSSALSLPLTLELNRPIGRHGEVSIFVRQSWTTEKTQGQVIGLSFRHRF